MGYRRFARRMAGNALALVGLVALQACDGHIIGGPDGVLSITSVSPPTGLTTKATAVTIQGTGFKAGATVTFGGIKVAVNSLTETTIVVTVPLHDPATVDVVVTNVIGGSVTKPGAFSFVFAEAPVITAVSPSIGSTAGGTFVTVNGSGFKLGLTATLDGAPLKVSVSTFNGIHFGFTAPPHAPGDATIVVRNLDGQDSTEHPFAARYSWAPPDTFDFTGNWFAYLGDGNDSPFSFSGDGNKFLVSVTCYEGTPMPLPAPVQMSNGQVSVSSNGVVLFSARLTANDQAFGTINFGLCHSSNWSGWKDSGGSTQRKR